jgi:hypothetical protein
MRWMAAAALLAMATPAAAEIVEQTDDGFVLAFEGRTPASPAAVLDGFGRPAEWWSPDHTWSGSAANLRLDLRPGGCWCEDLPGGGVRHGEVLMVWPERGLVRLEAPLGPLQELGAAAVLTLSWEPGPAAPDGARAVRWGFRVAGRGTGALAGPVDAVLQAQFDRFLARLDAGD